VLTVRTGKPHEHCFIRIQLEPIGRHPICDNCQTSGDLLQQGADIRWTTCTINLSISRTVVDQAVPRRTYWVRLVRYDWNHLRAVPPMPKLVCNLCSRMSWSTVSNAADRSNRTSAAKSPWSTAARMSDKTRSRTVSVE